METTETIREARRLTRPHDGRWLGGVAAGLGAYFDLNPAIYRIAFAALALAGGTGILLYVAAWLVIPDEGEEDSIAAGALKQNRDKPSRALGLALVAFVAILALSSAHFWPSPGNLWLAAALGIGAFVWWQLSGRAAQGAGAVAPRGGALFPIALGSLFAVVGGVAVLDATNVWNADWRVVLGAMVLVTGALTAAGAATGRKVGAIVALDVLLAIVLAVTLFVRVPLFAGVGDRVSHPASIAALDRKYELGIGNFTLDLADVPLPAGETRVKATLGIGDLVVHVPRDVKVIVDGRASAGEVVVFGDDVNGTSLHKVVSTGADDTRVLRLDARVGFGRLEVTRG
jgi:phage shock protein PspC (stress-responsive transcriptional regulator)